MNTSSDKFLTSPKQYPSLFRVFPETSEVFQACFPKYWSPYKTPAEKLAYVQRLSKEIQPFIRGYFQLYKNEMTKLLQQETVDEYLSHIKEVWNKHIRVNQAIDCFLSYEVGNVFGDWSPTEWQMAKRLIIAGMDTDHKKIMYSGGIKTKLDSEVNRLVLKYKHTDPEADQFVLKHGHTSSDFQTLLLTPSFLTFYEAYDLKHKKYILSILEHHPNEYLKQQLIDHYHSGDAGLFSLRLGLMKNKKDPETLKKEISDTVKIFKERALKKGYLMAERPDIKAFEALLEFDNTTEYEYTYSLKGLPDLFLREELLQRLIEMGEFSPDTSVFALSQKDFLSAIDNVLAKLDKHFTIHLRPYQQNFDTCGTACIMSILNRKGCPLDEDTELKIWNMVGKPYNFPGGLAWVLLRNGFHVTFVQDGHELLRRNNPEFASMNQSLISAAKTYIELHKKAVDIGLKFEVKDWGFKRVKSEIEKGNICLLYLYVSETATHVVIARGIKNNRLEIIDPLGSLKYLSEEQLNAQIIHPMGKRMLIIKKLPDDLFDRLRGKLSLLEY